MKTLLRALAHFAFSSMVDEFHELAGHYVWNTRTLAFSTRLHLVERVVAHRLTLFYGTLLAPCFRRSEWTANPADPTQVIRWVSRYITLVNCTWALTLTVRIGRRQWEWNDAYLGNILYDMVEGAYEAEQAAYESHDYDRIYGHS